MYVYVCKHRPLIEPKRSCSFDKSFPCGFVCLWAVVLGDRLKLVSSSWCHVDILDNKRGTFIFSHRSLSLRFELARDCSYSLAS